MSDLYEQQRVEEEAAYAEAKDKLPTITLRGVEYRFTTVKYLFWHRGRGWQIDGCTEDDQCRRYRYDDGGAVTWRDPDPEPEEATVGFFVTDHSHIPEIQRCDSTRQKWSDDQAAAYVLYQVAQQADPEKFARLLTTHAFGLGARLLSRAHLMNSALYNQLVESYDRFKLSENEAIADIELPEEPPEWLALLS